jgi:prepilin peptidase CpaA
MSGQGLLIVLHAALAGLLVYAAYTDLARREIDNWLNGAIALLAPVAWFAMGWALWPAMAIQAGIAVAVFALFAIAFFLGAMGGGDVKMIGALALWLPFVELMRFLLTMSIVGLLVTLIFWWRAKRAGPDVKPEIPYGVAIAIAGLWSLGERYLNQFG